MGHPKRATANFPLADFWEEETQVKPDDNTKPDADVSDKGPEISRRKVLTGGKRTKKTEKTERKNWKKLDSHLLGAPNAEARACPLAALSGTKSDSSTAKWGPKRAKRQD